MTTTVNPWVNSEADSTPTPPLEMPDGRIFEASTRIRPKQYGLYEAIGKLGLLELSAPDQTNGQETRMVYTDRKLQPGAVLGIRKWIQGNTEPAQNFDDLSEAEQTSLVERAMIATTRTPHEDDAPTPVRGTRVRPQFGDKLLPPEQFVEFMASQGGDQSGIVDIDSGELPYKAHK